MTATWNDIVWSAITAGKPGAAHLLAFNGRCGRAIAHDLCQSSPVWNGNWSLNNDSLDPTEKGATSYFLGMAMAKLFAAELFGTPWLFHVSQATSGSASIVFNRGSKSQPDLIRQSSSGNWIVVEAKGRTNSLDNKALEKAKLQTEMIRTINGSALSLRVALQVYFDDQLRVRIDDPIDAKPEALEVKLDLDAALAKYYAVASAITAS